MAKLQHKCTASGAMLLFGGWIKIYDTEIPSGTKGHKLYCAMGGFGVGGWNSDDVRLELKEGLSWDEFHSRVKSYMYTGALTYAQLEFFDKKSVHLGFCYIDGLGIAAGGGGGSVKVQK